MIKAKVSLENMEGFDAQLMEVVQAIDANLKETATVVRDDAKATSAFIDKTGNLRDSITMRKSRYPDGGYIVKAGAGGKKKGYHAWNVEFGHVLIAWGRVTGERVPPYPYLRPALEKGIKHAVNLFRSTE